jgi:hypothetical protein
VPTNHHDPTYQDIPSHAWAHDRSGPRLSKLLLERIRNAASTTS